MENELLSNSMTTLSLLLEVYSKINSVALKEFNACYQFIAGMALWQQLLTETSKKEFNRYYMAL